jgi:hypothetical protein
MNYKAFKFGTEVVATRAVMMLLPHPVFITGNILGEHTNIMTQEVSGWQVCEQHNGVVNTHVFAESEIFLTEDELRKGLARIADDTMNEAVQRICDARDRALNLASEAFTRITKPL